MEIIITLTFDRALQVIWSMLVFFQHKNAKQVNSSHNIRTYRDIKNKFNNGIRKAAKILYAREG